MTDSTAKSPSPAGRSDLDRRISRLAAKYVAAADPKTAVELASSIYPIVFSACYDLGGGPAAVSDSAKAVVEDVFDNLGLLLRAPRPASWITRQAYRIAAERALRRRDGKGDVSEGEAVESAAALTGPRLTDEARRGISTLTTAAECLDASLVPVLREALDTLPPRLAVTLILTTISPLPAGEIAEILGETGARSGDPDDALPSLTAAAAVEVFERLGRVPGDGC